MSFVPNSPKSAQTSVSLSASFAAFTLVVAASSCHQPVGCSKPDQRLGTDSGDVDYGGIVGIHSCSACGLADRLGAEAFSCTLDRLWADGSRHCASGWVVDSLVF